MGAHLAVAGDSLGMLLAALVAVGTSFLFPSFVPLSGVEAASRLVPSGVGEVLRNLAAEQTFYRLPLRRMDALCTVVL